MKKISALLLGLLLIVVSLNTAFASEIEKDVKSIHFDEQLCSVSFDTQKNNDSLKKLFNTSSTSLIESQKELRDNLVMDVAFVETNEDFIKVSSKGSFSINGKLLTFNATGELYKIILKNNNVVYLGGLVGFTDDNLNRYNDNIIENQITLSVHYNQNTNERFICVSMGQEDPIDVEYGKSFETMTEAFYSMKSIIEIERVYTNEEPMMETKGVQDRELRKSALGNWKSKPVVFASLWGPSGVSQNSTYKHYIKVSTNKTKFIEACNSGLSYKGDPYNIFTTAEHSICDYWAIAETTTTYLGFDGFLPDNHSSSFTVSVSTPWAAVNAVLANFISLNIPLNGFNGSYSNNYKKLTLHGWGTGSKLSDMITAKTTAGTAARDKKGITSITLITNELAKGSSGTYKCYGSVKWFYGAVQENLTVISKWQTCSTTQMSLTLKTP